MTIFNKRNALVGFITLKALERRRKRKQRSALKLVAFVALGIVSAGILAALLAVALRRNGSATVEDELANDELDQELESELDGAMREPADSERLAE